MAVEPAIWERAWAERDPAFDGSFFVCVRTTKVYCRCVCPVRLPFRRNVDFVPSAAAAEAAGFRPCLRCRPETTQFSPAWKGTLTTVERAFRLIVEQGALDGEGASVEGLAARLGMTERHLRRLFGQHLGATPTAVARTARVQRAKRLLSETELTMTEVAPYRRALEACGASMPSLPRFTVAHPARSGGKCEATRASRMGERKTAF